MPTVSGVYPCYKNQFTIGGDTIADMETFGVSFDNGIEEWTPYESDGWIRRLMTAKSITISVSGKRNIGDSGNDRVAELAGANGSDAEENFFWNLPDGSSIQFDNAIINVTNIGTGDSTNAAPLEFEVMSNGKPTFNEPSVSSGSGT